MKLLSVSRRIVSRRILPPLVLASGLAGAASAQTLIGEFTGVKAYDKFGVAVANVGDVNGDGVDDVAMGAIEEGLIFFAEEGYLRVVSGASGLDVYVLDGENTFDRFGSAVAGVGDVDGDGRDDFLVTAEIGGAAQGGRVYLVSGASGATIRTRDGSQLGERFGAALLGLGDINGDLVPDYAIGAPDANANGDKAGRVEVISGLDGSVLFSLVGANAFDRFGNDLASVDDADGDGVRDLVVGSVFGGVRLFSGASGALIQSLNGLPNDNFGYSVCEVSDVTGDGKSDFAVGAIQQDLFSPGAGYVQVFNGATQALVLTVNGATVGDRFGIDVANAGDWNADGKGDVLVGMAPTGGVGQVIVLSGLDGSPLGSVAGTASEDGTGEVVAGLGDIDGDLKVEFAVGAIHAQPNGQIDQGRVRVYESETVSCGGTSVFCNSTPNSTGLEAQLQSAGSNSVSANNFILVASNCPPTEPGLFVYSASSASVPFFNGVRCVAQPFIRILPIVVSNGSGVATTVLDLANPPSPSGQIQPLETWYFQYWFRDSAGGGSQVNTSSGLAVTFCP